MSKMSNHIVRQREVGIDVRENLTEEIKLVDAAVSWVAVDIHTGGLARGRNEGGPDIRGGKKLARELEKAWDRIKRSVKGEGYGEDYQAERG
jgi:hypothetical protein